MQGGTDTKEVEKVVYKIGQCIDYQSIYALEESFNKIGLTIQMTSRNRMILCKLLEGKALTERVVDDYIFIGDTKDLSKDISERASEKICDFVRTNAGKSSKVENTSRAWRNGLRMYESVVIVNEDQQKIAGDIICG
jgi:hypothetical protein